MSSGHDEVIGTQPSPLEGGITRSRDGAITRYAQGRSRGANNLPDSASKHLMVAVPA
jgi:hypothetical protein